MVMQQQQQQMAMATPFMNPLAAFGFGGSPFGGLFPGMDMMDPFAGGGGTHGPVSLYYRYTLYFCTF